MSKSGGFRHAWFRLSAGYLLMVLLAGVLGCQDMLDDQRYDTISVPPHRLSQIENLNFDAISEEDLPGDPNVMADADPAEELPLKIEECRALALETNLDLEVQLFNPRLADETTIEARAAFEPLLFSNFGFAKTDTPVSLSLDASQSEVVTSDLGLAIPLQTGGQITLDLPYSRVDTDNEFSTLNPSYTSDFVLSLSQPLLRQAGVETNTHAIRLARYEGQIARAQTKLEVIRVLAAVDRVYWRLYAARGELEVRKQEYDLAVEQLESARRMVEAGEAAEIEVIRAENAAAQRLEAIIQSDNAVRDRQRDLKGILNKAGLEMETPTIVIPVTQPNAQRYLLDEMALVAFALENRMELLELELRLAGDASTLAFQQNGMLPFLAIDYSYNINGLGPSADDAFDLMLDNRFVDQRLGLVLQVPLGNNAARSRWQRAVLRQRQRLASKRQRENLIRLEVLNAADQLETNWQRVVASAKSAILEQRTMEAEQRQFDLGLQTSTEVLDAQTRFADAQSAQIQALVEYQIAQVDLAFATGCLAGAAQIYWDPEANGLREK